MEKSLKRFGGLLLSVVVLFMLVGTEAMAKKKTVKSLKKYKKSKMNSKTKDGVYMGGNLAYVMLGDTTTKADFPGPIHSESTIKSKNAFGGSIVIGFKKHDMGMRFEAEYLTHKNDAGSAEIKMTGIVNLTEDMDVNGDNIKISTIFLSAYKLIKIDRQISGVIGGGVGSTKYKDNDDLDEKATSFHISGGIEKQINSNFTIVGMIRLIKYGGFTPTNADIEADISYDLTAALQAGIRYQF